MIRTTRSKQLTIAEFDWPFDTALDKHNRWVTFGECIPWDELADSYYQGFTADRGRPMKEARLVIGAVIIKHTLCLSDVEAVQQIQENPYRRSLSGCRATKRLSRLPRHCSSKSASAWAKPCLKASTAPLSRRTKANSRSHLSHQHRPPNPKRASSLSRRPARICRQ